MRFSTYLEDIICTRPGLATGPDSQDTVGDLKANLPPDEDCCRSTVAVANTSRDND